MSNAEALKTTLVALGLLLTAVTATIAVMARIRKNEERRRICAELMQWEETSRSVLRGGERAYVAFMLGSEPDARAVTEIASAAETRMLIAIKMCDIKDRTVARDRLREYSSETILAEMDADYHRAERLGIARMESPPVGVNGTPTEATHAHLRLMPPYDRYEFVLNAWKKAALIDPGPAEERDAAPA